MLRDKTDLPSTADIENRFDISRQTIYLWRKIGKLRIEKDWKGRLIWDNQAIKSLETNMRKNCNNDKERYETFNINNRRYLGSKEKLLPFIGHVVSKYTTGVRSVADIFAGTGVVANYFAHEGKSILVNDILHANYLSYVTFFGNSPYDLDKIKVALTKMNDLNYELDYYLEGVYGDKYFSKENASKIGSARQWVQDNAGSFNERERAILITSILYGSDKVANTVGHYDAYRKKMDMLNPVMFKLPEIRQYENTSIYCKDANQLVREISSDLVYIDTPYNSRQYVDTYHVLENIADWKKPEVVGIARKSVDRQDRKSQYNLSTAALTFDDLIQHIKANYILVSFNNMAHKGNGRSNSKISHEEIIESLRKRGEVKVFSQAFNAYTTGKSKIKNHKELLYLTEVKNNGTED